MSWSVTREYIDTALKYHIVEMEESVSGAQHRLQIDIGHDACHHCGHVLPKDNLGEVDPFLHKATELNALGRNRQGIHAYAAKHGVPLKRKDGKVR